MPQIDRRLHDAYAGACEERDAARAELAEAKADRDSAIRCVKTWEAEASRLHAKADVAILRELRAKEDCAALRERHERALKVVEVARVLEHARRLRHWTEEGGGCAACKLQDAIAAFDAADKAEGADGT